LPVGQSGLAALGLAALGIVFGDIGTSPLYTLKTVLNMTVGGPTPDVVFGVLSLIVWTLIIITSVKYVAVAMSVDNNGEVGHRSSQSIIELCRPICGRARRYTNCWQYLLPAVS
jgi:KUP system potassium uptake protein